MAMSILQKLKTITSQVPGLDAATTKAAPESSTTNSYVLNRDYQGSSRYVLTFSPERSWCQLTGKAESAILSLEGHVTIYPSSRHSTAD